MNKNKETINKFFDDLALKRTMIYRNFWGHIDYVNVNECVDPLDYFKDCPYIVMKWNKKVRPCKHIYNNLTNNQIAKMLMLEFVDFLAKELEMINLFEYKKKSRKIKCHKKFSDIIIKHT